MLQSIWTLASKRVNTPLAGLALCAAALLLVGAGVGYVAWDKQVPQRVLSKLQPLTERLRVPPSNTQDVEWRTVETSLHSIDVASINIIPEGNAAAAIEEVEGLILFAGRWGGFGFLTPSGQLLPLATTPPMNLTELQASGRFSQPHFFAAFGQDEFRIHDILTVQTGPHTYDLYATHHRYHGDCIGMSVSRTKIEVQGERIVLASDTWETIFDTRPCIDITRPGRVFTGHQSGGRLVQLDDNRLLLSVGDFAFDGLYDGGNSDEVTGTPSYPQDPDSDLGKIIEITLSTGASRIYATGFRNPQGLLVDSQGRVWASESGPQGGDEIDLVLPGLNYGWPVVTYGTAYGTPRRNWPFNPHQGAHDGYERPRFAFTPSIALSNIIETSAEEFPFWERHIMAGSLRGQALQLMRLEGDQIVYSEQIVAAQERIRDVIALRSGRIALATDSGRLILIRNADLHADEPTSFTVSGFADLYPTFAIDRGSEAASGRQVFAANCGNCHSVTGQASAGPSLDGVVGRQIGSVDGFSYSSAMRNSTDVWTRARLRAFLENPSAQFPGTSMPALALDRRQRNMIVDYLDTLEEQAAR